MRLNSKPGGSTNSKRGRQQTAWDQSLPGSGKNNRNPKMEENRRACLFTKNRIKTAKLALESRKYRMIKTEIVKNFMPKVTCLIVRRKIKPE